MIDDFFSKKKYDHLTELLDGLCPKITAHAKKVIVQMGDLSYHLYYVAEGKLEIKVSNEEGLEKVIMVVGKGDFTGRANRIGMPAFVSITAQTPVVLYKIDSDTFRHLVAHSEMFYDLYSYRIGTQLKLVATEVSNLVFRHAKDRLYDFLLSMASEIEIDGWKKVSTRITQDEMGKIIGAARSTVARIIGELRNEGVISIINQEIYVRNRDSHRQSPLPPLFEHL